MGGGGGIEGRRWGGKAKREEGRRGGKGERRRKGGRGEEGGLDDFSYFTVTASFTHPCGCWEEGGRCDSGGWGRGEGQDRSVKCHTKDHLSGSPSKGKTINLIVWS